MTNVKPSDLNYDHYSMSKYDRDIVNSIPHHLELHQKIAQYVKDNYSKQKVYKIIDLGVGTGLTSVLILKLLPLSRLTVVDFSRAMLRGAKKKLGKNTNYILGDYSRMKLANKFDIAVSVIGLHHQNNAGKMKMFKKIYSLLEPGGTFIFGDLVTYKDHQKAALNQARHFAHLVNHASDDKTLTEWAHHHIYLNDLAPVEDQVAWLKEIGFKVKIELLKDNTALIICKK